VREVNTQEAKTTLSQLVEAGEAGEKVIPTRAGKPVVELVRLRKKRKTNGIKLGGLEGKLTQAVLDRIARPPSKKEIEALFGRPCDASGRTLPAAPRRANGDARHFARRQWLSRLICPLPRQPVRQLVRRWRSPDRPGLFHSALRSAPACCCPTSSR
jgi:antitoxin (DNA-binding transcriptional repressor) of toxin-antitoxin stability system